MKLLPLLLALLAAAPVKAWESPFNRRTPVAPGNGHYRLIITGHIHGSSSDRSGFPAATMLANIDRINGLGAHLFLSTGDLFLDPARDHERYERSFFDRLEVPFFNVPGNHDKGSYYEKHFGPTFGTLEMAGDRIVLLDTERKDGSLDREQLQLLEALLSEPAPPRIFIISHRPVWAENDEKYGPLFEGNTRSFLGNNFKSDVEPMLERLSQRSDVYWVSGSMAGAASTSFFFQPHRKNLTYIQSAIRNESWDAIMIADVRPDTIEWSSMSLTGGSVLFPQAYDARWWKAQQKAPESFKWRLVPYYVRTAISKGIFWYGAMFGALVVLVLVRVLRSRRTR